jgi:signal transduction histidine kinase/ligand-binding sensor domain-containing protein/CheY-like chemotaxis protein
MSYLIIKYINNNPHFAHHIPLMQNIIKKKPAAGDTLTATVNRYIRKLDFSIQPAGFLFVMLISMTTMAQRSDLRFKHIDSEKGLSNNIINCITQDESGFIWIATMEGLNRFDGYKISSFYHNFQDSNSLADNMIYDIFQDKKDNLWIGTQNGLCLFDPDLENFRTFILDKERVSLNTANRITGIEEDSGQNLYVAAELGSLFKLDEHTGEFKKYPLDFGSIKDLAIDDADNLWLGGVQGLSVYRPESNSIRRFDRFSEGDIDLPITNVNTLMIEGDTVWAGTIKGRIFYILRSSMEIAVLDYNFENTYYINDIYKASDGLIFISTTDGLFQYDKTNLEFSSYRFNNNDPTGLNTPGINMVFEDRQKNLWVGTYQGGVNLAASGKAFRNYNYFSAGISLDLINVNTILEAQNGILWLGSFDEGINSIDFSTSQKQVYKNNPDDPNSLGFGSVYEIFEDSRQNLWVGTYLGYLQKLNRVTGKFTSYPFYPEMGEESPGRDVRSIIEDEKGYLWLLSHSNGMSRFDPKTGKYRHFLRNDSNLNNSIADNWAFQLLADRNGFFWIATPSGLSRFDPVSESFLNFSHSETDSTSLCNNYINLLFEDSYGRLWIGTSYGLDLFNSENKSFTHFYAKDGLPGNQIKGILEHRLDELWISTGSGLSRMRISYADGDSSLKASFRNYNRADNLQDTYFWNRSACKLENGDLAFGGENGLLVFNPDEIMDNQTLPRVYLTDFRLFNQSVPIGAGNSVLAEHIRHTNTIRLRYDQNFITLEFVAINYISNEENKYRYRLWGLDNDWVEAGGNREASYTNLDPGEYTFQVIASNNDDIWNNTGASVRLVISPPFWGTWWFRSIAVLFLAGLVFSLYLYRVLLFRKQKLQLERRVKERTLELSKVNEELVGQHAQIVDQNQEIINQNIEINRKNEEIENQKIQLEKEKLRVEKALSELTLYRNKLEEIVDERTRELIFAKERAEESDQLKSSFLANLSHEIRTPLNSIIGFSTLLFDDGVSMEEKKNFKSIIESSTSNLLNLISDIIDFSKIESHDLELKYSEIDPWILLKNLDEIYKNELERLLLSEDKQVKFSINLHDDLKNKLILTDITRLQQILRNILNNAIKFTNHGQIMLSAKMADREGFIEFSVEDTGMGIPDEYTKVIFHRFRKIETDKARLFRGTGLGLTICQHLVKIMGGDIWVESELGKGSKFSFTIPERPVKIKEKFLDIEVSDVHVPALENIIILVAEDDMANFMVLERMLRKTNARVIHASNGKEVVDLFAGNPGIKLIFMDIKMPEMDGIEALMALQKNKLTVPVVAQTAYAFENEVRKIRDAGFDDYIAKPIKRTELFRLLTKYFPG